MRFLYQETTEKEEEEIHRALEEDQNLLEAYKELCSIKNQLDCVKMEPSSSSILNILAYSRRRNPLSDPKNEGFSEKTSNDKNTF